MKRELKYVLAGLMLIFFLSLCQQFLSLWDLTRFNMSLSLWLCYLQVALCTGIGLYLIFLLYVRVAKYYAKTMKEAKKEGIKEGLKDHEKRD